MHRSQVSVARDVVQIHGGRLPSPFERRIERGVGFGIRVETKVGPAQDDLPQPGVHELLRVARVLDCLPRILLRQCEFGENESPVGLWLRFEFVAERTGQGLSLGSFAGGSRHQAGAGANHVGVALAGGFFRLESGRWKISLGEAHLGEGDTLQRRSGGVVTFEVGDDSRVQ